MRFLCALLSRAAVGVLVVLTCLLLLRGAPRAAAAEDATPPAAVEKAAEKTPATNPAAEKPAAPQPTKQTVRIHIYADPRVLPTLGVAGGPNGNGRNLTMGGEPIVDFWWTVAVNDIKTQKYLTETGFMFEVLDAGDGKRVWHLTTTQPGQQRIDLPVGAWYTLEIQFRDNAQDKHLAATLNVQNEKKEVLYDIKFDHLYQNPTTDRLGEVGYLWFTNFDTNMRKVFTWCDPKQEIIADKAEVINVATFFPAKVDGSLQDASTLEAPGTGGTVPHQWEAMQEAATRLGKFYPLVRREVTRSYKPPYPEEREAFIKAYSPAGLVETPRSLYLIKKGDYIVPGYDLQAPPPPAACATWWHLSPRLTPKALRGTPRSTARWTPTG